MDKRSFLKYAGFFTVSVATGVMTAPAQVVARITKATVTSGVVGVTIS